MHEIRHAVPFVTKPGVPNRNGIIFTKEACEQIAAQLAKGGTRLYAQLTDTGTLHDQVGVVVPATAKFDGERITADIQVVGPVDLTKRVWSAWLQGGVNIGSQIIADVDVKGGIASVSTVERVESTYMFRDEEAGGGVVPAKPELRKIDFGDLMTVADFQERCQRGSFIDYDGHGVWATATERSQIPVIPSDIKAGAQPPEWATHVLWFNR